MSFATTFRETLDKASKPLDLNYEANKGFLPVVLQYKFDNIPYSYTGESPKTGDKIDIKLKSIREPKFSLEYSVPSISSVYGIKERLISDPSKPLKDSGINADSIKLLLKGKVVSDSQQIAELSSTQFTVMFHQSDADIDGVEVPIPAQVYWSQEIENIKPKQNVAPSGDSSSKEELPGVTDKFWSEVELVAKRYVADPKKLVEELKSSYSAPVSESMDLD